MVLGDLDVFLWFHDIGFGSSELCVGKFGIGLDELIRMSMVLEGQQMNRGRRQRRKPYNNLGHWPSWGAPAPGRHPKGVIQRYASHDMCA